LAVAALEAEEAVLVVAAAAAAGDKERVMLMRMLARCVTLLTFLLLALGAPPLAQADTMDAVIDRGTLRIGIAEEDFLPWIGRDKAGKLLGFEVDVAHDLARVLGVKPEFVETPLGDLLNGLVAGRFDVIISAYSVTTERARLALFSVPYGQTDYYLLLDHNTVPKSAADGDYDVEGFKIGVIADTIGEDIAARSFTKAEIVPFPDDEASRDALSKGEVGAIIAATPIPNFMMLAEPDRYALGSEALYSSSEAVAARPDSLRFINFIDAWIEENRANGRLQAAREYWFDTLEWEERLSKTDEPADKPAD
jgi:polar amino acid transport system substrate-binding protein